MADQNQAGQWETTVLSADGGADVRVKSMGDHVFVVHGDPARKNLPLCSL